MNGGETAIQVIIEFDKSLLQHFDVPQWNAFVADLLAKGLIPPVWVPSEKPDPIAVMLDFSGLRRGHYRLDGIDLRLAWLGRAEFTGASLRNARMGCCRDASFRSDRLDGADFRDVEISGCDFAGATGLGTALFDGAAYDPANPPTPTSRSRPQNASNHGRQAAMRFSSNGACITSYCRTIFRNSTGCNALLRPM